MQSNHNVPAERARSLDAEATVSLSHVVHTLRAYRPVIILSMIGLAIGLTVIALVIVLLSPTLRTTSIPFRLDFKGAEKAQYPNDLRFAPDEIVSAPVLLPVYTANQLERFVDFGSFSRSLFVLESNAEYEKLAAAYQAHLADPKLTAVDRDRVESEFALRRDSLAKNEYAISYLRSEAGASMPDSLVRKVLSDVLAEWANYAVQEQHVLDYRISVLSPQILDEAASSASDYITRIEVLRAKLYQVLDNVVELEKVPGAELARTASGTSLREIRMRLEEITRFGLEPLVAMVRSSGLVTDAAAAARFLQSQLAFDQRRLQTAHSEAESIRQSMAVYFGERQQGVGPAAPAGSQGSDTPKRMPGASSTGETVMPQLSDSFLDRLVALSARPKDDEYRRALIKDYRDSVSRAIVIEQAVAYDRQVLNDVKEATAGGSHVTAASVETQITSAQSEVRQLIVKMNEIYQTISRHNVPSKQLYTQTGTPVTRAERTRSVRQLALYEAVILMLAMPMIVLGCLAHNRVREEEAQAVPSDSR